MELDSAIFVAGHRGLVGSAIVRRLRRAGYTNVITRTRQELDLLDQRAVREFFRTTTVDYVFVAAARVGGIHANATSKAEFLIENLLIESNVIGEAARADVRKLLFLGSSCIYPREAPQPMREEHLLTGPLEPTNEAYAIAKIAGLKLCEYFYRQDGRRFISAMPTNLYGPNDNFHPEASHVIPGLLRRFHEARVAQRDEVVVWGTGKPLREFLHVDDLSDALLLLMNEYEDPLFINVGSGIEQTIAETADRIASTVGYRGRIVFDLSRPDGTPRKLLDISRIRALGWEPSIAFEEGLRSTYAWAVESGVLDAQY